MAYSTGLLHGAPSRCPAHLGSPSCPVLIPHTASAPLQRATAQKRVPRHIVRAGEKDDDGFEGRLSKLKGKDGKKQQTPKEALQEAREEQKKGESQPKYDYSDEKDYFVTAPHRGDLATNLALAPTLLWLPLSIASVARAAFVKYRFTTLRLSVTTKAPGIKDEQLDAAYQEVKEIKSVPRGFGYWGDMVITLKSGDKIELRALPKYREMEEYVLKRRDELRTSTPRPKKDQPVQVGKGF